MIRRLSSTAQLASRLGLRHKGNTGFSLFLRSTKIRSGTFQSGQTMAKAASRSWRLLPRRDRMKLIAQRKIDLPKRNDFLRTRKAHAATEYSILMKILFTKPFPEAFFSGEVAANIARATLNAMSSEDHARFQARFGASQKMIRKTRSVQAETQVEFQRLGNYDSFGQLFNVHYGSYTARRLFVKLSLIQSNRCNAEVAEELSQKFLQLPEKIREGYEPLKKCEEAAFSEFCVQNAGRYTPTTFCVLDLFAMFRGIGWLFKKHPDPNREAVYRHLVSLDRVSTPTRKVLLTLQKMTTSNLGSLFSEKGNENARIVEPYMYKPSRVDEATLVKTILERRANKSVYDATLTEASRFYNQGQLALFGHYTKKRE